ncbi:MAG TPA: MFS transporter [Steroidobacteraceae bacterium]|jgi:MFS family permease|nr:MFS transporter [Steroidobacteraceae bacterium]
MRLEAKSPESTRRTHSQLSLQNVRTLALTAVGGALEYYDFIVAVFFTKLLAAVFFPPQTPTWAAQLSIFCIFAAGYLVRPIGGLFFAHYGDRLGRKKMFALSLFVMVLPTFCVGILPGFNEIGVAAPLLLLVCRVLQGLSVGGQAPGAFVFASEHVRTDRVGFACGLVMSGICTGILLGALTATLLNSVLSKEEMASWGWRIPFIAGGIAGFIAVYLRRFLRETPVFESLKTSTDNLSELPLKVVLRDHLPTVILSMLGTWIFAGVFVVFFLYMPTYLQTQWHLDARAVFTANSWSILLLIVGSTCTGWLVDKVGWAKTFFWGNMATGVLVSVFFYQLAQGSNSLNVYIATGFFIGVITVVPYIMVTAFPPAVRFTGFSLSFNTAYAVFGGTAPAIMAALVGAGAWLLAPLFYIGALSLMGMAIGMGWKKPSG